MWIVFFCLQNATDPFEWLSFAFKSLQSRFEGRLEPRSLSIWILELKSALNKPNLEEKLSIMAFSQLILASIHNTIMFL